MIWAAIRDTLNSTLGTAGFRTLDQLINTRASQASVDNIHKVAVWSGTHRHRLTFNGPIAWATTNSVPDAALVIGYFCATVSGFYRIITTVNSTYRKTTPYTLVYAPLANRPSLTTATSGNNRAGVSNYAPSGTFRTVSGGRLSFGVPGNTIEYLNFPTTNNVVTTLTVSADNIEWFEAGETVAIGIYTSANSGGPASDYNTVNSVTADIYYDYITADSKVL